MSVLIPLLKTNEREQTIQSVSQPVGSVIGHSVCTCHMIYTYYFGSIENRYIHIIRCGGAIHHPYFGRKMRYNNGGRAVCF